ncbi:MAG TPA: hypothetical protein VGB76_08090, partial [Pyrinomonadaceae bacterium]
TFAVSLFMFIATLAGAFSASTASDPTRTANPAVAAAYEEGAAEYVTVYAKDCRTPQTVFYLGDTVCITAGNFPLPLDAFNYRRLSWIAPNHTVANQALFYSDPQTEYFEIPTSGALAQVGTWHAATINVHSGRRVNGKFYVRNPRLPFIDLSISMAAPEYVYPGQRVRYNLSFHNPGPDFAEGVQIIDEVPSGMTFYALKQVSGPFFECSTPALGETGRIVCNTKGLQVDETAQFAVYYLVNRDVREGTVFSSLSYISSYTDELHKENNVTKTETIFPLPDAEGGDIDP